MGEGLGRTQKNRRASRTNSKRSPEQIQNITLYPQPNSGSNSFPVCLACNNNAVYITLNNHVVWVLNTSTGSLAGNHHFGTYVLAPAISDKGALITGDSNLTAYG